MSELLSTTATAHLLHSTTTTLHLLPGNQGQSLTSNVTSLVHTDCTTIRDAILSSLPSLINPAIKSGPQYPQNNCFESLLTVDRSTTGKPVKKLISFALQLEQVSANELSVVTLHAAPHATSGIPAYVEGSIVLDPESADTTRVTMTAVVRVKPDVETNVNTSGADDANVSPSALSRRATRGILTRPTLTRFVGSLGSLGSLRTLDSEATDSSSEINPQTGGAILSHVTNLVLFLHTRYSRYSAVDAAMYSAFESFVSPGSTPTAPPIQPREDDLVNKSLLRGDDSKTEAKFKRVKGTVLEPVSYYEKVEGNAGAWGKAVATVDVSATRMMADRWCLNSYENKKSHVERQGADALREVAQTKDSHSMLSVVLVRFPNPVSNRVFATWFTWRKEPDDSFTIAFAPLEDFEDKSDDDVAIADFINKQEERGEREDDANEAYRKDAEELELMIKERMSKKALLKELYDMIKHDPVASQAVRGTTRGYWRIEPLAPAACRVTCLMQVELGGSIPTALLNARIFASLNVVQKIQVKFARNGKLVDKEMRDAFPKPLALAELSEEQGEVVESCRYLESEDGTEWEFLKSPSPFVRMSIAPSPANESERSVAIGKATAVVDCPALEAAEFMFAYTSRERMRLSNENLNPARLLQRANTAHDQVFATIKRMPFPLRNREFVGRQVCATDTNGDLVVAFVPVDDLVDYGMNTRTVRGLTRALMRFTPSGESQCKVTLIMYVDACGVIPTKVIEKSLPQALSGIRELRDEFQRDDEIDQMEWDEHARVMKEQQQVYSEDEDMIVQRIQDKLGAHKDEDFDELESLDHLVWMGGFFVGKEAGIVRASTIVDASVEECGALELAKASRAQIKMQRSLQSSLTKINDHQSIYYVVKKIKIPGFVPREFLTRVVWKKQGQTLVVVYEALEHEDFPTNNAFQRAESTTCWKYETLERVGETHQTRATLTQNVDLKGSIPKGYIYKGVVRSLMSLSVIRKAFDKSLEIDGAVRAQNVGLIAGHDAEYSEEENALLEEGEKHFTMFGGMKVKSLKMASPLTTAEIAYKSGDRLAWGRATTTVRARPKEVMAFLWDPMRRLARSEDDLEKSVEKQANGHSMLGYTKKKTPKIIADRDFLNRVVWKKEGEGFVFVSSSEESEARLITDGVMRAKYPSAMRIKRKNDKETTLEYVIHPDAGGRVPSFIMNRYLVSNLSYMTEIQEYFLELRKMEDYDADDGKVLGVRLMHPGGDKGKKPFQKVRDVVGRHSGLHQLSIEYDWLVGFLEEIVRGRWVMAASVSTKLECLSEKEARKIGRSLMPALKQRKTAEAGLHQWKMQNLSMVELFERYDWVESMVLEVAQEVMNTAPWGLMWRVCTGASLSVLDIFTDIIVIVGYMEKEETRGYGYSLLGMLVASMVLQLMMVFLQNRKKPWAMAKESLVVITGMKAPWDAWSVCSGKKMEEHNVVDAKMELMMTKCSEMFCESIPGCLLQLFVILKVGDTSGRAVTSVIVSALTTGYSSGTISYDYDTDPVKRKETPDFYGYIPDEGIARSLILVSMTLNSALLLLIRAFSAAMLMMVRKRYLAMYMAGDMALYLLQKVARGDFHHWFPLDGALGLLTSLLLRMIVKTITDFTGVIHFRGPQELGGLYWTVNMFLTLLASFICVWIGGGERMEWNLVGALSGAWVVVFGLFLLLIQREYWLTFFTLSTAKQQVMDRFNSEDESVKAGVFKKNKKMWRAIREDVKEWVQANWWRWKEEKPEWFSEAWIGRVDADMIPLEDFQVGADARVGVKIGRWGRKRTTLRGKGKVYVGHAQA